MSNGNQKDRTADRDAFRDGWDRVFGEVDGSPPQIVKEKDATQATQATKKDDPKTEGVRSRVLG